MSIASVVLDYVLNKDFLKNVAKVGNYLKDKLKEEVIKKYPTLVSGIRGKGLMLGIESKIKNEILIKEMINQKLLTVKASQNIIRILPPLILEEKHVDEAISKINKAFTNLK
jgi:acetylornithine/N-succinyldiaminopimelate aminotransferase